jgi:hypothetical protein
MNRKKSDARVIGFWDQHVLLPLCLGRPTNLKIFYHTCLLAGKKKMICVVGLGRKSF